MANLNGAGQTNEVLQHGRIAYGIAGTAALPILVDSTGILASVSKTIQTESFAAQSAAASTWTASNPITIPDGTKNATFYFFLGRGNTTAIAGTGTEFRVEVSATTTGNDKWTAVTSWYAATAASNSCAQSTVAGGAAGSTVVTILSGTAMTVGDLICFTTGTIEWARIAATAGTASFTVLDGLTAAHTGQTGTYGGASATSIIVNTNAIIRARVVVNNNYPTTSQPIFFRAGCILGS